MVPTTRGRSTNNAIIEYSCCGAKTDTYMICTPNERGGVLFAIERGGGAFGGRVGDEKGPS